jgi:hypothetical protein
VPVAEDITTTLVNLILAEHSKPDLLHNASIMSDSADLLDTAASWAQLLGTAAGPAAQLFTRQTAAFWAAEQAGNSSADAAGEAATLTAAASIGVGLAVAAVLVVASAILASVVGSDQSSSAESEFFQDIMTDLGVVTGQTEAIYWYGKQTGNIQADWVKLGDDLDDLASEGTGGVYVTGVPGTATSPPIPGDVASYHSDGQTFLATVMDPLNWGVPQQPQPSLPWAVPTGWGFADAPYMAFPWNWWYGPLPLPAGVSGPPGASIEDPRTMLSLFAMGLQSYITLESVSNIINPALPTIAEFVEQFSSDLENYLSFIYGNYQLAVLGIVKTATPSLTDLAGFIYNLQDVLHLLQLGLDQGAAPSPNYGTPLADYQPINPQSQDENGNPPFAPPTTGASWNGVYGACETYPLYGVYPTPSQPQAPTWPWPPAAASLYTSAYFISGIDFTGAGVLANDVVTVGGQSYLEGGAVYGWLVPWLQNRIILGNMARWKAVYLVNGYQQVWDVITSLQRLWLSNPPDPANPPAAIAPTQLTLADGTIANGNWSLRELFQVVNTDIDGVAQLIGSDPKQPIFWGPAGNTVPVYSMTELAQFLYIIANGDWPGPPYVPPGEEPSGPYSLRQLLAQAAR